MNAFPQRTGGSLHIVASEPRYGLSLLEVIVVLAIIGLVLSISLPAILSAKASSKTLECSNRLRQVSIAITNYHDQHGQTPPNGSMYLALLPYIEQAGLAELLAENPPENINRNGGTLWWEGEVTVYACPSEITPARGIDATTNYCMNHGVLRIFDVSGGFNLDGDGFPNRFRDVLDGLSNTAMISEKSLEPAAQQFDGSGYDVCIQNPRRFGFWRVNTAYDVPDEGILFDAACNNIAFSPDTYITRGFPTGGITVTDRLYMHTIRPNSPNCGNGIEAGNPWSDFATEPASSYHPGGINLGLGDNSVRFISDNIDLSTWRAFGTRSRGETM